MSALAAAMVARQLPPAPRPRSAEWLAALKVDPRQAIEEERIICLICGGAFRQLTNTHLQGHETSAADYKRQFGYNRRRPLMCLWLLRFYAERAVRNGLALHIRRRPIVAEPELRRRGGSRPVALEELLTRRDARRTNGRASP